MFSNAYEIELPTHMSISNVFNVKHLTSSYATKNT